MSVGGEWTGEDVDVLVMGSGAAGLAAAVAAADRGATVLVVEKSDLLGGTTGVSGGMPWVPLNRHLADVGVADSREEALAYIHRLTLGQEPDPALVEHYVDTAGDVIEWLETVTPLRFSAPPTFNDYYEGDPGVTGGKRAGRSIEPEPFAASTLGPWAAKVRTSPHLPRLTLAEGAKFLRGDDPPDLTLLGEREAADIRVGGPALVAALCKALLDRGVELRPSTPVVDLVHDDDGAVVGARIARAAGETTVTARGGVVMACGGFEWNRDLVAAFIGRELCPLSPAGHDGDGLLLAMRSGAALANMTTYWGQPAIVDPAVEFEGRPMYQMGSVRSTPGVIAVNRHGRRFTNEGASYQDFPKALGHYDATTVDLPNSGPVWLVFDQAVRDRAMILPSLWPGMPTPDWIATGATLGELAGKIGVDGAALAATVAEWNDDVERGVDRRFGRGTLRFESQLRGERVATRDLLAPVSAPPFYAVQLHNGALGTIGGPRTDREGRVCRPDGRPIAGLYAAGNAAAGIFGGAYPGGGASIGPALVFGTHAGRHAAGRALSGS